MALQAPQYNGPRMGQMPFVPADADAFGAAEARQDGRLARQGLGASLDVLEAAQEQQRRCDTAAVKDATNQMRMEMLAGAERIMAERGANAQNAPAEMQALLDAVSRKYDPMIAGGNVERQESWARTKDGIYNSYMLQAERKRVTGMMEYEQNARSTANEVRSQEMQAWLGGGMYADGAPGKTVVHERGDALQAIHAGGYVAERIEAGRREIMDGLAASGEYIPPGYAEQRADDWEAQEHIKNSNAMLRNYPRQAVEYFNQPRVREVMGEKAWAAQMKTLQTTLELVDAGEDAEEAFAEAKKASDPKMALEDARLRAYNDPRYQGNSTAQKQYLAVLEANIAHDAERAKIARAQSVVSLTEKMIAADFDFNNLSPEEQMALLLDGDGKDTPHQAFTRLKEFKKEGFGPDWAFYDEMKNPGAAKAWMEADGLRSGGRAVELAKRLGGDKAMIKEIIELSKTDGGDGSGGGGARVSVNFNPGEAFEGMFPKSELPEGDERDFRKNGFIGVWRSLVAHAEEHEFKRPTTRKEQEAIAQQLYRDIDSGAIDVRLPYFKQVEQYLALRGIGGEAAGRIEIGRDAFMETRTVLFEEKRHNRGEDVANLSPAVGSARQNFGVISPRDKRQLPPAIIDAKAAEVLRAYQAGRIGNREYAAADFIVYDRTGTVRIFSPDGEQKGDRIKVALPPDMDAVRAAAEEEELKAIRERTKVEHEINFTGNSRAEAERELLKIKDAAGEAPGLATQRVIARREKRIRDLDKGIRFLRGEDVSDREAVVRKDQERQLKALMMRRDEVQDHIRRGGGRLMDADDKRVLKRLDGEIKALQEEMK